MTSWVSEMERLVKRLLLWPVLCVAMLPLGQQALAQQASDTDRSAARELGREGLSAIEARDYVKAVDKLGRALSLYKAPTLYLARARARVALGRLVAAADDLRQVVASVPAAGESQAFAQARVEAQSDLEALEQQIPRLTLTCSEPLARVLVNGAEWPPEAFDVARPLDPGSYVIEAITSSGTRVTERVELRTSQVQTAALVPRSEAQTLTSKIGRVPASHSPAPLAAAKAAPTTPSYTAGYVSGAVSVALLAGAIISGVVALEHRVEFDRRNRADVPLAEKTRLQDSAKTWAWVNTGLMAGALAGAGVTTYLFFNPAEREGVAMRLGVTGKF
jgi:hypothetical protein